MAVAHCSLILNAPALAKPTFSSSFEKLTFAGTGLPTAKPQQYLLLPHNEILESKRLPDYLRFEVKR